jgi:L-iditol 2-dehydrogenase
MSTAMNIRRVTVQSADRIVLEQVELPAPGDREVRVASSIVGICGSDLHAAAGRHPFIDLPYSPGHEAVGVVEEIGAGVSGFKIGDRVVVEPNIVCGSCRFCLDGRYNLCERLKVFGCQLPGAMGDAFVIGADRLHHVPAELSDSAAVLIEPLGTPLHALRVAGGVAGRKVVVLGAGSIGLLVVVAARRAGAETIVVTDLLAHKLARAVELGADSAVRADEAGVVSTIRGMLGGSADLVFDCVSSQGSIADAIALAQNGGTVICIGVAAGPVEIPLHLVQDREVTLRGSAMYTGEDIRAALAMLESGTVPVEQIVTAVLPLEQVRDAFALAASGRHIKVAVSVDGDAGVDGAGA